MNWYPWLNSAYRQLIGQYSAGRGHHALLLHSVPGNGDTALRYALGRWLLCQRPNGTKSCGECHSCHLMQAGHHPDYHLLAPEKGKTSLGVESIRQLIDALYAHANQDGAKVVAIDRIEWLTEAAANALLKTLEEPSNNTYFLFGCYAPERVLATLRSRCFFWHLACPDEHSSLQWLARQAAGDPAERSTALRLSHGAPIAAEQLLQPERWQQRMALCRVLAESLQQADLLKLLPQLNHDQAATALHWLCSLLLDAQKWQQGLTGYLVNVDQPVLIEQLATRFSGLVLQTLSSDWIQCYQQLLNISGINQELLLTEQLLQWEQHIVAG
ncbi:DNA polymerase III subunit delta' [Serratia microhaemolytica]|uniref:DNA polymerase III subunit delta' n=1 Tax=Serratia microhaemolytica TaxID=2675110 RepID=UPI000FDE60A1|nr:DNA polymerase III subunit delta' [Serratia microhaemolytica]